MNKIRRIVILILHNIFEYGNFHFIIGTKYNIMNIMYHIKIY